MHRSDCIYLDIYFPNPLSSTQSGDAQKFRIKETTLCFGGLAAAKTFLSVLVLIATYFMDE